MKACTQIFLNENNRITFYKLARLERTYIKSMLLIINGYRSKKILCKLFNSQKRFVKFDLERVFVQIDLIPNPKWLMTT